MNISECFGQKSVNIYSGCYKLFRIYITRSVLDDSSASFIVVFGGHKLLIFFYNNSLNPRNKRSTFSFLDVSIAETFQYNSLCCKTSRT